MTLFVLSWTRVQWVVRGGGVLFRSGDFVVLLVVEVCVDYGGVKMCFMFVLILVSSMVLGFVSIYVV